MFRYKEMQTGGYGAVMAFNLPIFLRVIGRCCEFFHLNKLTKCSKELAHNWGPLSVNTCENIPYGMTQLFKNIVAIYVELILAVGIARVNLESWYVILMKDMLISGYGTQKQS